MKRLLGVFAILLACAINADAQLNNDNVLRYIDRYRSLAMSEQQRTGIPAAIKLAQGIHETGAGTSKLAREANNHFGLKCKNGWTGDTYKYTDDRPNECFRKYNLDFESYQDQSNYLKASARYASLFSLSVTDYAGWAMGLRKAGYATNPQYAQLLIKIIEDYRLQEYTYAAMGMGNSIDNVATTTTPAANNNYNSRQPGNNRPVYGNSSSQSGYAAQPTTYGQPAAVPANTTVAELAGSLTQSGDVETIDNTPPARESKYLNTRPRKRQTIEQTYNNGVAAERVVEDDRYNVTKINNLKAVYGKQGDMPLQYAVRNGIRYEKFLEMNDLEEKPLPTDMPLYLERKHFWGIRPMHLVKPGETMLVIAQKEGIQLKYLRDLNYMEVDEEPMPGVTLELQAQAGSKPAVRKHGAEDEYNTNGNTAATDYAPQAAVRTFRPNPAPPHEEEKPLWERMKEAREIRRQEKAITEAKERAALQATTPQLVQQPVQQQATTVNTQGNIKPNPAAQAYGNTQNAQPVQQQATTYGQAAQPVQQQPVYQQQQTTQQPVQSYSSSQYSYSNTNVKPNPAAEQYIETKPDRKSRRERKKEEEDAQAVTMPAPQPQKPKSELDALKEQFDNVIYAGNNNAPAQRQAQQPAYNQQQNNYQQPQQQAYQQQNNYQSTSYGNQQQQQPYAQQQAPQQQRVDPSKIYTVKRGDTAYTIAKKHGITIRQLMDWNGLDFDAIKEGQTLRVKQ